MSGYVSVFGPCYACGQLMSFSPTRVPSAVVDGVRQPICQACVDRMQPIRAAHGLPPIVVLPGAYEADREEEVPWHDD